MTEKTPTELLTMLAKSSILIEGHLRSIRSMLKFFTVLVVLALILQVISGLFSFVGM